MAKATPTKIKSTTQVRIGLELTRPAIPANIGQEALDMAFSFERFRPHHFSKLASIIREGFKSNFETESEAGTPWSKLAKRTLEEREDLGFPYPSFPMLVRRGEYRASYITAGAAHHVEKIKDEFEGASFELHVGSTHPFAPTLAGDVDMWGQAAWGTSSSGALVPPRRAHVILDKFGETLATEIGRILWSMLRGIKTIM